MKKEFGGAEGMGHWGGGRGIRDVISPVFKGPHNKNRAREGLGWSNVSCRSLLNLYRKRCTG